MAIDNRTPEEILADLEERRKDHKFMTTEEAQAWDAARGKRPLSDSHWMTKRDKEQARIEALIAEVHQSYEHMLKMAELWKRLAKSALAKSALATSLAARHIRRHSDVCPGDNGCICGGR